MVGGNRTMLRWIFWNCLRLPYVYLVDIFWFLIPLSGYCYHHHLQSLIDCCYSVLIFTSPWWPNQLRSHDSDRSTWLTQKGLFLVSKHSYELVCGSKCLFNGIYDAARGWLNHWWAESKLRCLQIRIYLDCSFLFQIWSDQFP